MPGSRTELRTNGRLRIELAKHDGLTGGTRQVWRDGKVLRLEDQLQDVLKGIWTCAQELAARKVVQDRREAEERARREALEAEEERRERERTWTEDLDERLKLLARGKAIRELLERLPRKVKVSEWGRWLEAQAEDVEGRVIGPSVLNELAVWLG